MVRTEGRHLERDRTGQIGDADLYRVFSFGGLQGVGLASHSQIDDRILLRRRDQGHVVRHGLVRPTVAKLPSDDIAAVSDHAARLQPSKWQRDGGGNGVAAVIERLN